MSAVIKAKRSKEEAIKNSTTSVNSYNKTVFALMDLTFIVI